MPLKEKFPSGVKALLWNESVKLKSLAHPNHSLVIESSSGNVRVSPSFNNETESNDEENWKVESFKGKYFTFTFRENNETLFVNENGTVGGVFISPANKRDHRDTFDENDQKIWEILPIGNGSAFKLRNKVSNRFLMSGKLEECSLNATLLCGDRQ